jgi:hypothetical protein
MASTRRSRPATNQWQITGQAGAIPDHPCLDAALEASRPALLRLYAEWQDRRQAQVVEYVSAFQSSYGHPPAAADVAAALEPRISEAAALWYVERINGHDRAGSVRVDSVRADSVQHSIPDFSESCKIETNRCAAFSLLAEGQPQRHREGMNQ